jgi:hypothetical protein
MKAWHWLALLAVLALYASGPTGSMRSIVEAGDK